MGKPDDARKQFDLILSGKNLEANAATRKGKYSLEVCFQKKVWGFWVLIVNSDFQSALVMRTHAAIEALDHDKPL